MVDSGSDIDEGVDIMEDSPGQDMVGAVDEDESIVEPCEGMEFDSEDAVKMFYDEYARKLGFVMRVMTCRRSERNGRIVASAVEDEKDKRIQELTMEMRNKKRLCTMYQQQLTAFIKIVEEHNEQLSMKVENVVKDIKEVEPIEEQ